MDSEHPNRITHPEEDRPHPVSLWFDVSSEHKSAKRMPLSGWISIKQAVCVCGWVFPSRKMPKWAAYVFIMKCQTQLVSHAYRWLTVRVSGLKCVFYPQRCYNFIKVSSSVWSRVTDPKQLKSFIPKYDEYSWHPLVSGVIIEVQRSCSDKKATRQPQTPNGQRWREMTVKTQIRQETPLKSQKKT